jgi:hypothetical protein
MNSDCLVAMHAYWFDFEHFETSLACGRCWKPKNFDKCMNKALKWVVESNYLNRRANELESLHLSHFASYFVSFNVNTQVGGVTQHTSHVSQHY